jgi:lipid A 4'-phosphatase
MSQVSVLDADRSIAAPAGGLAAWQQSWRNRLRTPWTFQTRWPVAIPVIALIAMTLAFRWTSLDLTISSWFYNPQSGLWDWFFLPPCTAFYRLGIYPPFALAILGGVLLVFGWLIDGTGSLPRAGLFLVLVMLLGPGLIVNLGFKTYWGRARPHEVKEFNGRHEFSPVGSPGVMLQGNSSFPSGHAALAFYLMAPGFLAGRRRPRLAAACFATGALYGLGMSAVRVAQGGHFTSDVLWSGGIVYLLGALLAPLVLRGNQSPA